MIGERLPCVIVLAFEMSEQLDRLDVGVAVDDAAGDRRSHMRELFGPAPDPRHEIGESRDIKGDPKHERTGKPPVGPGENNKRAEREDRDEPERVDDLHNRFPERSRRLHDVGRNASGEVVGEIGDRLAQNIAVCLPADEIGQSRGNRLLDDEIVREARHRPADEDQERHRQKLTAVILQDGFRPRRSQDIHEFADEAQDGDFDQRNDEADRHHGREERPDLAAIAPIIADEARGRRAWVVVAKRVDRGLEQMEHELKIHRDFAAAAGFIETPRNGPLLESRAAGERNTIQAEVRRSNPDVGNRDFAPML